MSHVTVAWHRVTPSPLSTPKTKRKERKKNLSRESHTLLPRESLYAERKGSIKVNKPRKAVWQPDLPSTEQDGTLEMMVSRERREGRGERGEGREERRERGEERGRPKSRAFSSAAMNFS